MRHVILAPLIFAAGVALLSAGCTGSSKPTAPVTNLEKSTQMQPGGGQGQGKVGRNPRTVD